MLLLKSIPTGGEKPGRTSGGSEKVMWLRALVANPLPRRVPGNPFVIGTAERVVIAFIIFIIFIIVRRRVSFKR